ncbi:hypothetical protein DL93DRAFT_2093200 [Clavulina sp. PMI_390]|nr:hypothetical protein DL93DRAFT_2093200 [Clavulina sp. PMI_390]
MANAVNITKVTTLGGTAVPLTYELLPSPVPTLLSDLRVALTSVGVLTSTSQQFLNNQGFPIPVSQEAQISWLDLTNNGKIPLPVYFPAASAASKTTSPTATLPDAHKFDTLPTVADLPLPAGPTVAPAAPHSGAPINANELTEAELAELFDINSLLSGYNLAAGNSDSGYCSKAFLPPTTLKPLVHVDDRATIDSITTFSASAASLARQGFDSASLGVSTPWASGSLSAANSRGTGVVTKDSHAYITGVYRFSRAFIGFHDKDLHPTDDFKADLEAAFTAPDDNTKRNQIRAFFSQYGHAFAFSVEVGGLLYTTKETIISSATEQKEQEQDIRGALAVSVQAPGISANAGGEHAKNNTSTGQGATDKDSLWFEATGGDTLLASDPPNWTKTVADYQNWRICKISNMKLLTDIPGLFTPDQLTELARLAPMSPIPTMKTTGPVKPLQGKWVAPKAVQDSQGFSSFKRFTLYGPTAEQLAADGGWYYLGQTTSSTSALIVRQNPAWRPIVESTDPSSTGAITPPPVATAPSSGSLTAFEATFSI